MNHEGTRTPRAQEVVARMGRIIAGKRKERNLDLATLAARAGISVAYISMLESGQREARLDVVLALARALRCKPQDFYDFTQRAH